MALFGNDEDKISEELLKKSMEASKNAQVVETTTVNTENNSSDKHSLAYLEANGINATSSIKILGDKETFDQRLKEFYTTAKTAFGRLMEYKANMDMTSYAKEIKLLKDQMNYLCIDKLFMTAKLHEKSALKGDSEFVVNNFKAFEDEIANLTNIVNDYLN